MNRIFSLWHFRDPSALLALILIVFFLKGVFLSTIQPIFGGQDEARHYNTIQYLAEPTGVVPKSEKNDRGNDSALRDKDNFDTYNFSEEIQKTAKATDTGILRKEIYNTINFSDSSDGIHESAIREKIWKPYNYYLEPDTAAGAKSLYHRIASSIERFFAHEDILVRFSLIRIFSVLLGTFAVFLTYQIARTIGFSGYASLILTAILSFQPKFSLYLTNINYDALLIPSFFLFTSAGALALKNGLDVKSLSLLFLSLLIATETKGTGYILVIALFGLIAFLLYEKMGPQDKKIRYGIFGACFIAFAAVTAFLFDHFFRIHDFASIGEYISKTITWSRFVLPSETYWGTLSWVNSPVLSHVTDIIFLIEIVAIIGLGLLLFSKKFKSDYPSFLPARKYVIFLIGMIVALQLGIRIADWNVFSQIGGMRMSLGTPGRYFLPNLAAHILLIGAGLGAILAWFGKERYFETLLLALLIGSFSLMTYLIFNVIILRFYF